MRENVKAGEIIKKIWFFGWSLRDAAEIKYVYFTVSILVVGILLTSCNQNKINEKTVSLANERNSHIVEKQISNTKSEPKVLHSHAYNNEPTQWGEQVEGVHQRFQTNEKKMALTFDACGGPHGNDYDHQLIDYLRKEQIPATLFVNERWIHANKSLFLKLAKDPLFHIANHGTEHKPLSVNGKEIWNINGTNSPQEVVDEIMKNHHTVQSLTGMEMKFFRSGTAYYDEVAVQIANDLGYKVVNFDILGDAGATYSSKQVSEALLQAKPGSIALLHMNQPNSETAEGVKQAIPKLKAQGFTFTTLEEQILQ